MMPYVLAPLVLPLLLTAILWSPTLERPKPK
jgi:hypothetical protein